MADKSFASRITRFGLDRSNATALMGGKAPVQARWVDGRGLPATRAKVIVAYCGGRPSHLRHIRRPRVAPPAYPFADISTLFGQTAAQRCVVT
jgi:hypothetical protein